MHSYVLFKIHNIGGFLVRVSYYASCHHYIMSQVGNRIVACGHHQNAIPPATIFQLIWYADFEFMILMREEKQKNCKGGSTSLTIKYSNLMYEMLKCKIIFFSLCLMITRNSESNIVPE